MGDEPPPGTDETRRRLEQQEGAGPGPSQDPNLPEGSPPSRSRPHPATGASQAFPSPFAPSAAIASDRQHVRFSLDSARDRLAAAGQHDDFHDSASPSPGAAPSQLSIPGRSPSELYTIPSRGDLENHGRNHSTASVDGARNADYIMARQPGGGGAGGGGGRGQGHKVLSSDSLASSPVELGAIATTGSVATTMDGKSGGYRSKSKSRAEKRRMRRRRGVSTWDVWVGRAQTAYQKVVIEGILRRKPLPPSKDGRHIPLNPARISSRQLVDERTGKPYISNFIRSSRYTVWDFLPKQLIFQFSKLANFYFLIMGIMQMIPGLSTTGTYTTIGPLIVFVAFSMAKEGYDDYRRYRLDRIENRSETWVLDAHDRVRKLKVPSSKKAKRGRGEKDDSEDVGGEMGMGADMELSGMHKARKEENKGPWAKIQWQDVRVGDIVRLDRDDNVPADLILLHATGPNGVAYIETMALDGETNLKSKQASPLLAERCGSIEDIRNCQADVVSEDPNVDLYSYDGRVTIADETLPLGLGNIVYRGSTLRNTSSAVGIVVNSGEECKIRMNASKNVRAKAPAMQWIVNRIVIFLVFFVVALSVGLTGGYYIWRDAYGPASYLINSNISFKEIFIAYVIMFNTLIPLSLYISLEIIKIGQLFLLQDVEMYDPVTDTPMVANTTTILEDLGQVSHVFSDKTGTLTENVMRFRKMSVAGTAWLHDMDIQKDAEERERKILASMSAKSKKKGKTKQYELTGRPSIQGRPSMQDRPSMQGRPSMHESFADESVHEQPLVEKRAFPPPLRKDSFGSSAWKSTTAPKGAGQPELKTEDLLEYLRQRPNTAFSRKARHFLLCIALCHTCLPERKPNGDIDFQASSPDELALVEAARDMGFLVIDRPAQVIKLQFEDPTTGQLVIESYQVLDVIEFSSKRKRMSIIIRMPDGRICIFSKGADSIIMQRLRQHQLAQQKAVAINRRSSKRKSMERERAISRRLSANLDGTNTGLSIGAPRTSLSGPSRRRSLRRASTDLDRLSNAALAGEFESWITARETEDMVARGDFDVSQQHQTPTASRRHSLVMSATDMAESGLVDEAVANNDALVFERVFQHIDDFATEGLRTLLYAYRYIDEQDYSSWKALYHEATTSLVDRQERIEKAADVIEQSFDLAGATAIEDKLQDGVPDTIDKLRRANIKVWMLTGDKRETAINIGHSARLCKPFSEIYILDASVGTINELRDKMIETLRVLSAAEGQRPPHSVLVIDGHTLGIVEAAHESNDSNSDLDILFFDLAVRVDSVICCRASPAQKAGLVKAIRRQVPSSMTLAIGDGANDIGMIQASHVGIGISGREGLQAARIADYSIAQFRFLQRLLFVHGRWNYIRTGKYILATFWKEIVFFLVQAHYQRFVGYTGTSLFENWSLTVFNSFFTSLPVILMGIFDKDLAAETLLAVPELYTFGQKNLGFNFVQYVGWMIMGVAESFVIYYFMWGDYQAKLFTSDTSLYAMGVVCFTVAVLFINIKLLVLEVHHKTIITFTGLFISAAGWFVWNLFLAGIYPYGHNIYLVRHAFIENFGRSLEWWCDVLLALSTVIIMELVVNAIRRVYWPRDQDIMQRMEKDRAVRGVLREHADQQGGDTKDAALGAGEEEARLEGQGMGKKSGEIRVVAEPGEMSPVSENGWHQQSQQQQQQPRRQPRASYDDYRPQFTPPAEERENPFDGSSSRQAGGERGFVPGYGYNSRNQGQGQGGQEQWQRQVTSGWMGRPSPPVTQSPVDIEMQTPSARRRPEQDPHGGFDFGFGNQR